MTASPEVPTHFDGLSAIRILQDALTKSFQGRIALVSSFGTESAVLLHQVADIDPSTPVIFLDTGKLFGETRRYARELQDRLGLTDLRFIRPEPAEVEREDPDGVLWLNNHDRCCAVRKVWPLRRALRNFDAWITGRKRHHGGSRESLPLVEMFDGKVKINPLAGWTAEDVGSYFKERDLPEHPLKNDGFLSIGCMPCTERVRDGGDIRDGRWAGSQKTECGIHLIAKSQNNGTNENEQPRYP